MKKYLLDTNIISYLDDTNIHHDKVKSYFEILNEDDILAISIISIFEYQSAIDNANDEILKQKLEDSKKDFIDTFEIINLSVNQELIFSNISKLYKNNTGINNKAIKKHNFDFLIATQAIDNDFILVSNDDIFKTLTTLNPNLKYENWTT